MDFITGESRNQMTLLPDSIDDYVDANSSVRVIDTYINSLDLLALDFSRPQPNDTGHPMYDPKDLLKLYVYGYMNRIRSSRRLEAETKRNLEVMWLLCRLSPDHKTIARFRHNNTTALKNVFRHFVKFCMQLGLYGKELVAIDGSKFKAVNSKHRNFNDEKLKERIAYIDAKIEEYLRLLEDSDSEEENISGEKSSEEISQIIAELIERKDRYQEYAKDLKQKGALQKSLTDSDSRLMMANGKMDVCYNVQSAVDGKYKLVVDFEVTNSANDKNFLSEMAHQAATTLGNEGLVVVADVGYDSATDIAKCLRNGIHPHVAGTQMDICLPIDEPQAETITSHLNGRSVYIPERNIAICPMGRVLRPGYYKKRTRKAIFYNQSACKACSCKCTMSLYYQFEIDMKESVFTKVCDDKNLSVTQIAVRPDKDIIRARKSIVEHPFGTIKRNMDSGYCLTKGLQNVSGEFSLTFLTYNLKRAINIIGGQKLIRILST
jgi:transposase